MRTKQLLAGLFVLLATLTSTAAAASADEARYCVTDLATGTEECYTSSEAVQRDLAASEAVPVLYAYQHINYNRDEDGLLTIFTSPTTCTTAYDNELNKKRATLVQHKMISSWATADYCRVRFWENQNFVLPQSALSHVGTDCPDMRTCFGSQNWNDRAASLALT
ncbi:hypothetical protein AB0M48_01805 [Lentzea sp. NPDC051208]|uniref:hypothetical protein n=1 Tax=Lentzea sp. NPDC051208 TaxID=3154642 RepID=UPI003437D713